MIIWFVVVLSSIISPVFFILFLFSLRLLFSQIPSSSSSLLFLFTFLFPLWLYSFYPLLSFFYPIPFSLSLQSIQILSYFTGSSFCPYSLHAALLMWMDTVPPPSHSLEDVGPPGMRGGLVPVDQSHLTLPACVLLNRGWL